MTRLVVVGGGPGGYEGALVAAQLGADVTIVDRDGLGGSAVLTDCVPSKALISTTDLIESEATLPAHGVSREAAGDVRLAAGTLRNVNARIVELANAQSRDIERKIEAENIRLIRGIGRLAGPDTVVATANDGSTETLSADIVLLATGARPRELPTAVPDGERILTWEQIYALDELPERLIVIGSGVTGAEFASAYTLLGSDVVLVSSRDRVLPGEDPDAAIVLEDVLTRRGLTLLSRSRAESVTRDGDVVRVVLSNGTTVEGSHCLVAVGSVPNTDGIGLAESGVELDGSGFIVVDRVSRTSARGVYAAGDCTGVLMLASVAAMQGRVAVWHALGDAVDPLDVTKVASNVFTAPEIATVGVSQSAVDSNEVVAHTVMLSLAGNARAKMQGVDDGFIKLFALPRTGTVVGGVVVGPRASELIHPVSLAVASRLTVEDLAHAFTVYPSISGSVAEAARQLHIRS
ncbi:NAD(P)H-quinone dehydrogenase [Tsukamurella soli]|uniref:NAD(P)H-quinone dehydrogenase n=1 Tax=Tsukamurella soli TaxID=644556 RepID=A0ABP8J572_9ACTN